MKIEICTNDIKMEVGVIITTCVIGVTTLLFNMWQVYYDYKKTQHDNPGYDYFKPITIEYETNCCSNNNSN